jgi:hypothetical protein
VRYTLLYTGTATRKYPIALQGRKKEDQKMTIVGAQKSQSSIYVNKKTKCLFFKPLRSTPKTPGTPFPHPSV